MTRLNLGCGPVHLPTEQGWVNTDLMADKFQVEQQWDFRESIPLPDDSVDFILAWHILEHAGLHERGGMIKDFHRVLRPGGKLALAVPDIKFLFEQYQQGKFDWYILCVNLYGPYNGFDGDYHRWGYSYDELVKALNDNGFTNVSRLWYDNVPMEIAEHIRSVDGKEPPKIGFADWAAQVICTK